GDRAQDARYGKLLLASVASQVRRRARGGKRGADPAQSGLSAGASLDRPQRSRLGHAESLGAAWLRGLGARQQGGRIHALGERDELRRGSAPAQLVHLAKERRIVAERGQPLEQQSLCAALAQRVFGKVFDRTEARQELSGCLRPDPG